MYYIIVYYMVYTTQYTIVHFGVASVLYDFSHILLMFNKLKALKTI